MLQLRLIGSRKNLWGKLGALREIVRLPFYNNALSLILLQGLTSVFGYLFWLMATRTLPADRIGFGAALYAAAMFLVGLAVLGFDDGLIYYLPRSRQPGDLINATYSVTALVTAVLALGFVVGIRLWAPDLASVQASAVSAAVFVVCAVVLQIGTMQDAVFVA